MKVMAHAQGYVYKMKARREEESFAKKHYYTLALEKFEEALQWNPTNKVTLRNCGQVVFHICELEDIPQKKLELLQKADDYYLQSVSSYHHISTHCV
jgi:hypothetical protein